MAADPAPREELHRLIDLLDEEFVEELVQRVADRLRNLEAHRRGEEEEPLLALLRAAPPDDEPLTAEDEAALEEADEAERAGRVRPLDEAFRDLDEAET
jgi:hypothetical protein